MAGAQGPAGRLSAPRLAAFSILGLAISGVATPLAAYVPPFYAQQGGIGLAAVGLVFMLCRLWGAFCDPLVGLLSDRTRSRFGRRRPWIAAGSLLFIAGTLAVFMPPEGAGVPYVAVALAVLYLGFSMTTTPLYAWSGQLSPDYHGRSRVQAYLVGASSIGLLAVLLIPTVLDRLGAGAGPDGPALRIGAMGWFVVAAVAAGGAAVVFGFREPPPPAGAAPAPVRRSLALLVTDPAVRRVIGSDLFVSMGQGFRTSMFLFFVSAYLGLAEWASLLLFAQYLFGLLAPPIWLRISYRFGKHRTVIAAELFQTAINAAMLLLVPGEAWAQAALVVLIAAQGLSQGSGNLVLRSIISDIADLRRSTSGEEHAGFLFSIFSVTQNAGMALAVGIAFSTLAAIGFVPGQAGGGQANGAPALEGLRLFFALSPAIGHALSALLMWRFPLDEAAWRTAMAAPPAPDPVSAPAPARAAKG